MPWPGHPHPSARRSQKLMLVRALGLKEYTQAWDLQKRLVEQRLRGDIADTLLLVEHLPVYTQGISSKTPRPLGLPYPLHQVERGGDITYHGPGQLVGYPIFHLGERNLRPRSFLRTLEAVLIETIRPLGIEAEVLKGFTGVWAEGKKIASIGIAVKNQVSFHGFALNVDCDLEPFGRIHPCNLEKDQMTSLQKLLGRPIDSIKLMQGVAETFLAYFGRPSPAMRKA